MKQGCAYHPTRSAHWECPKCGQTLCSLCIISRQAGGRHESHRQLHLCPVCHLPAHWLGVEHMIAPFWQRLPKFFAYPFKRQPLILIFVLAAAGTLVTGRSLVSWLLRATLWGVLIKYSYSVLLTTASGNLAPPPLNSQSLSEDFHQVFKQVVLFVIIGMAFAWVAIHLGRLVGGLFLLGAMLLVPAMIILLATTNSLIKAINPLTIVPLAMRIGWSYLLMYFFLSLLGGAPAILARSIIQHLPAPLQLFLFGMVNAYYTIISYHLMGYVILQYHRQIGYQVDFEDFKDPDRADEHAPANETEALLERTQLLVKAGRHEQALELLQNTAGPEGFTDAALFERYYSLLKFMQRTAEMKRHRPHHLDLLTAGRKKAAALALYSDCLADDNTFVPPPKTLFTLAGWLNETGKSREAIGAFNRLVKAYPDDDQVPKAYFRAAQIFHDRLLNPLKAQKILKGLIRRYPHHNIITQAETYLSHME